MRHYRFNTYTERVEETIRKLSHKKSIWKTTRFIVFQLFSLMNVKTCYMNVETMFIVPILVPILTTMNVVILFYIESVTLEVTQK